MINKRKLKVMLSTAVAAATLVTSAMSAFAEVTYTSVTTYNGETVSVSTTVIGAQEGEQLTYLAYVNGDPNVAENIVYIDQAAAGALTGGGTGYKFTFTADSSKVGADIKSGAATTVVNQPTANKIATPTQGSVTVNIIGSGTASSPHGVAIPITSEIAVTAIPDSGKYLSGASLTTYEGNTATGTVTMVGNAVTISGASIEESPILNLTFASTNATAATVSSEASFNATDKSIFIPGTVAVNAADQNIEFGVLIARKTSEPSNWEEATNYAGSFGDNNVYKFKALGSGKDGKFAMKLVDTSPSQLSAGKYYIKTYVKVGGAYTLSPTTVTVDIP